MGSVALHAVLGLALWQLEWLPAAGRISEPTIVPVALRAIPNLPAPATAPPAPVPNEAPRAAQTPPPPDVATAAEPVVDLSPLTEAETEIESEAETQPDAAAEADALAAAESAAEPEDIPAPARAPESASVQTTEPVPASEPAAPADPSADELHADVMPTTEDRLEAARREAVARTAAAIAAQAQGRDFAEDPAADSTQDEDGDSLYGDAADIFEAAAELRKRGGLLTQGRARSRIGQRISQLCNDLTGGFSLFGIVNVCADAPARADLFGHLRPQYMESLPLCTASEELALDVESTQSGAVGQFTCVLVPAAERAAYYRQYDPELAGWLPAESTTGTTGTAVPPTVAAPAVEAPAVDAR